MIGDADKPWFAPLSRYAYGFDDAGRRTFVKRANGKGDVYKYDATDQLTNVLYEAANPDTSPSGWTNEARYAFEPAGNRTSVRIGWDIWDLDGWDELFATGYGSQFSFVFNEGEPFEGDTLVRFYCDANLNGRWDSWERKLDSQEFWVQQIKVYNLSVRCSTLLGAMTVADVQEVFTANAHVALKKDSVNDWRACFAMNVASVTSFTPSAAAPDPCRTDAHRDELLNDGVNVTLVSDLGKTNQNEDIAGWAGWTMFGNYLAVDWNDKSFNTVVHELGHTEGLEHRDNIMHIMHYAQTFMPQFGNECTKADADDYD